MVINNGFEISNLRLPQYIFANKKVYICHMMDRCNIPSTFTLIYLFEIQSNGNIIIDSSIGQSRTLPPWVSSIDCIGNRVSTSVILAPCITDVTMRVLVRKDFDMVHQLTKYFTFLLTTSCIDSDGRTCSQIQNVRE